MYQEPYGLSNNKIEMRKSYMFSDICPIDKSELIVMHKILGNDNETILRWNVRCPGCGRTGMIFNE